MPTTLSAPAPDTGAKRVCNKCGELKDIRHFTRFRKGEPLRRPVCTKCRHRDETERRRKKRQKEVGKDVTKLGTIETADELTSFLRAIMARGGGLAQYRETFWDWYFASPPGSARRQRAWSALVNADTVRRQHEIQNIRLQEKQLDALLALDFAEHGLEVDRSLLRKGAIQYLAEMDPEIVTEALEETGWSVERPKAQD